MSPYWHKPLTAWKKSFIISFFICAFFFLVWLVASGLYFSYPSSFVILFLSITFFITYLGGSIVHWKSRTRHVSPAPKDLGVDVFITTLNEDTEILRLSIRNCRNMDYIHRTYVLDDGNREEVKRLAAEMGVGYLGRRDRKFAKAGNLNHALSQTSGEFIAVFDADGVPRKNFLKDLLGYFQDPKVAIIQTNQFYYNFDSFQHSQKFEKSHLWHEQSVFYDSILCGKDASDAATWCGNGSLLRRSALEKIGGVAVGTITEDFHTSILLNELGYITVYDPRPLVFSLAACDYRAYIGQRNRWEIGFFQVLLGEWRKFFLSKKATGIRRLCFLAPLVYYFESFPRILYFFLPLILIFDQGRSIAGPWWVALFFVGIWLWREGAYYLVSRSRGTDSYMGAFWFLKMWRYAMNILLYPLRRKSEFYVTPKIPNKISHSYLGKAILGCGFSLSLAAVSIGTMLNTGMNPGLLLASVVAIFNSGHCYRAAKLLFRKPQVKEVHSYVCRIPVSNG